MGERRGDETTRSAGLPTATLAALAAVGAAAVAGALVLVATRADPMLSPDSMTYLSAADHLRRGAGFTDLTEEPLTVFGPIYPLLLSPGGRSLAWAATVGAVAMVVATLLFYVLLRDRVRPWVAVGGAVAFACAQGMVRVASAVWSEAPYTALALGTIVVLTGRQRVLTDRRLVAAGVLAGLGFLTRYAGAGLVATGVVIVVVTASGALRHRLRSVAVFSAAAAATCAPWVLRNLVRTGEPLGPRFEGGSPEAWGTLVQWPLRAIGQLLIGPRVELDTAELAGTIVVAVLAAGALAIVVAALLGRDVRATDVGIAAFAMTSFFVPVFARMITFNDIEYRVMSPMLVPMVYAATLVADALARWRVGAAIAGGFLALWAYQGLVLAADAPDALSYSAGSRTQYAPELYDAIDALPDDATVLTNSIHRVWWQTGREPVLFAFTRPRPGNSHYPLDADEMIAVACRGNAHLAWFGKLLNAGDGPDERRPDLLAVVDLTLEHQVPGGELYLVTPRDIGRCSE